MTITLVVAITNVQYVLNILTNYIATRRQITTTCKPRKSWVAKTTMKIPSAFVIFFSLICVWLPQKGRCSYVQYFRARSPDLIQYGVERLFPKFSTDVTTCQDQCMRGCVGFAYSTTSHQCQLLQKNTGDTLDVLDIRGNYDLYIRESVVYDGQCPSFRSNTGLHAIESCKYYNTCL